MKRSRSSAVSKRTYGLELTRVGGSGDEGIDGIGLAPISDVLSSRVAVQVKRWDPSRPAIDREVVALFQRDAAAAGAERAVLVTLSELVELQGIGVRAVPQVDELRFDRFDA
jgi:restriction system protein